MHCQGQEGSAAGDYNHTEPKDAKRHHVASHSQSMIQRYPLLYHQSSFFCPALRLLSSSFTPHHKKQFFLRSIKWLQLIFNWVTMSCRMTKKLTVNRVGFHVDYVKMNTEAWGYSTLSFVLSRWGSVDLLWWHTAQIIMQLTYIIVI